MDSGKTFPLHCVPGAHCTQLALKRKGTKCCYGFADGVVDVVKNDVHVGSVVQPSGFTTSS